MTASEAFSASSDTVRLRRTTDHLQIDLNEVEGKVNLEDSCIIKRLRELMES